MKARERAQTGAQASAHASTSAPQSSHQASQHTPASHHWAANLKSLNVIDVDEEDPDEMVMRAPEQFFADVAVQGLEEEAFADVNIACVDDVYDRDDAVESFEEQLRGVVIQSS